MLRMFAWVWVITFTACKEKKKDKKDKKEKKEKKDKKRKDTSGAFEDDEDEHEIEMVSTDQATSEAAVTPSQTPGSNGGTTPKVDLEEDVTYTVEVHAQQVGGKENVVKVMMKAKTPMGNMFRAWCLHQEVLERDVIFSYGGVVIGPKETLKTLGGLTSPGSLKILASLKVATELPGEREAKKRKLDGGEENSKAAEAKKDPDATMAPVVAGDPEGEAQKKDPEAERKEAESMANPKEAERKPEVEALKEDEKKMAEKEGKKEGHERKEEECRDPTDKALAEMALNRLSTEDLSQQGAGGRATNSGSACAAIATWSSCREGQ